MARLEPDAPVYAFPQPDGTSVTLDLSVRNGLRDFAMEMRYGDGVRREVSVYHTGEPKLFVELLHCWAHSATPSDTLTGIAWVREELEATTNAKAIVHQRGGRIRDRRPTDQSENDFDYDIQRNAAIGAGQYAAQPSQHHAEDPSFITLTPDSTGLALTSERENQPPLECRIATADLPALVAGMIWRSYEDRGMSLSRLNTATYLEALGTFERAVRARVSPPSAPAASPKR